MSKRMTTRWYIGAWVIALIAVIVIVRGAASAGASSPPAIGLIPYTVMGIAGIVMLVMWIGALAKLGMQHAWGWFVAVLVLHLVGLGIVGMVAYAVAGPDDAPQFAIRPSAT